MNCPICNGIDPDCANCELIQPHQKENTMFQVTSTRTMQAVATGYATRAAAHEAAEGYERLMGGVYIVEEVPAAAHPIRAGQAVTHHSGGGVGIVTEPARLAGVYKGKVSVMWLGSRYEVMEDPEELDIIPADLVMGIISR